MKHIGLFEGIGGFSLAARWMGWETIAWCEWMEFNQKILKYHFPNAKPHGDITKTDFNVYRGQCDILTGGFPCQPYSTAGKRKGKEDDRHLWPEMLRAIREIQPRWIVGENVLGLLSWSGGMVFDEVQLDLETAFKDSETYKSLKREGYESFPYVLPACGVNGPHRRYRVWFVAYDESQRRAETGEYFSGSTKRNTWNGNEWIITNARYTKPSGRAQSKEEQQLGRRGQARGKSTSFVSIQPTTDTNCGNTRELHKDEPEQYKKNGREFIGCGRNDSNTECEGLQGQIRTSGTERFKPGSWDNWPTVEPTIRSGNDGLSNRLDGITISKHREESIKGYGNAIVPQVVYQIFKAIEQYELIK